MRYWDSSALVPLLVRQEAAGRMMRLLADEGALTVWWGTRGECDSAIVRLERDGFLPAQGAQQAFGRLDDLAAQWHEVQPVDILRETARRILRLHNLRAAGALQLAAALLAAEQRAWTSEFVCLNERLALAAAREGFIVVSDGKRPAAGGVRSRSAQLRLQTRVRVESAKRTVILCGGVKDCTQPNPKTACSIQSPSA